MVYLDDVISFGRSIPEALARLEEVLSRLSDFGLQLKAKKCTLMQTEVVFLGHIVGRTGLACDPAKISAVRNSHAPDKVNAVRQFVGFVGYYRRFVKRMPVGGVLNQIQGDREVVITYASRSLRLSQRRYCTTRREMFGGYVHAFPVVSSGG